jgi:ABC transporter
MRSGAGKTTTMRMILGLDRPTAGSVTVNGKPFAELYSAMPEVGALLDAGAVHSGRSAYNHLLCMAQTNGIPRSRVGEVISIVGLEDVAGKRSKGFSLGMSQRLGIAEALLGDLDVLMFDEPVNGLDPEGILLYTLAAHRGRRVWLPGLAPCVLLFAAAVARYNPGGHDTKHPACRTCPPTTPRVAKTSPSSPCANARYLPRWGPFQLRDRRTAAHLRGHGEDPRRPHHG